MAKIYFRRQATIPPTGTNGICVFCTTNETLYLDGIPYGGGCGRGAIKSLTKETWWGGKTEVVIEDGVGNIDLTDVARQYDVQRLLEDVAVIKSELEIDGPLNPSGDPRSAIDILNEDLTKVNKDLQHTKNKVETNTDNIAANKDGITNLNNKMLQLSATTAQNAKDIAVNAGKINQCFNEHELLKNEVLHHHKDIVVLQNTYVSGVSLNGVMGDFVDNVVYLTARTYDKEIKALSDDLNSLSGEVVDFEEQVATDIDNLSDKIDGVSATVNTQVAALSGAIDGANTKIEGLSGAIDAVSGVVDTKIEGVAVDGTPVPVSGNIAQLKDVTVSVVGRELFVTNLTGGTLTATLPSDIYISGGVYDAQTEELVFTMTNGQTVRVNVKGLVDVYTADGNSIVLNDKKFSVSTAITNTIDENADNIASISGTYISGITVNGVQGDVTDNVATVNIPVANVKSDDKSVRVSATTSGANVTYDLSILNKEIIDYLYDLLEYKYLYNASAPKTITIDITSALSGSTTVSLSSGKYRGLDYPTYSKDNPQAVSVSSSTSASEGWTQKSADNWSYTYTITDKTVHTASPVTFKAVVTNADGESGETEEVKASITINKPYFIIEGKTTPDDLNAYLASGGNYRGVGNKSGDISFKHSTEDDFFYVCVPSNKNAKFLQLGSSAIETTSTEVTTDYGKYKVYKSLEAQKANVDIKGTLTIS